MKRGQLRSIGSDQLVDRRVPGGDEGPSCRGADALGEIMRFGHRPQLVAADLNAPVRSGQATGARRRGRPAGNALVPEGG